MQPDTASTLSVDGTLTEPSTPNDVAMVLDIASTHADSVDESARFPSETFDAIRTVGLLGALARPAPDLRRAAATCQALAGRCGSSGMILAMHHIKVASLARHAAFSGWHQEFVKELAKGKLLVASSTSEAGVGGDLRSSKCALERNGDNVNLLKDATAISYGEYADAIFVTSRSGPSAPSSDQVMSVVMRDQMRLTAKGEWNPMGMRGTASGAFLLDAKFPAVQVVPAPFHEIATATMVPLSHILWSSVWTGIAANAIERAHRVLRSRFTASGTTPPEAEILALGVEKLQLAEAYLEQAIAGFDWNAVDGAGFSSSLYVNGLKIAVSEIALEVAGLALRVCGFAGYARNGSQSVSRHLRDLYSAPLMIANGRIRESSARMLAFKCPPFGLGQGD